LPDEFSGTVRVFFVQRVVEKRSPIAHGKVFLFKSLAYETPETTCAMARL
jgi:hypothetical protein